MNDMDHGMMGECCSPDETYRKAAKNMPEECMMGREVERHSPARVGKKISKLMHEGKEQDQAVAMALSMEREHRLTESGGYVRKKKGR